MKINQSPVKSKKIQPNLVNPRTNPQKPTKNLGKKNIQKKKHSAGGVPSRVSHRNEEDPSGGGLDVTTPWGGWRGSLLIRRPRPTNSPCWMDPDICSGANGRNDTEETMSFAMMALVPPPPPPSPFSRRDTRD